MMALLPLLLPLHRARALGFLAASLLAASSLRADQDGFFTYEDQGAEVIITDYPEDAIGHVIIPSSFDGKPVTAIASGAFRYCSGLTGVEIPSSVVTIGVEVFAFCSDLRDWTTDGVTMSEPDIEGRRTASVPRDARNRHLRLTVSLRPDPD